MFGSMVQKGKFALCALALDKQLNKVDLPTFGRPTIPAFISVGMHKALLAQQDLFCFYMILIGNTTVNRAYGSALWLVVKALTLGAFIRNNKINLI
jgi:DUF1009 family protein